MKRVLILVEGQTEEAFVGRCLSAHLEPFGVYVRTVVLTTKQVAAGPNRKGGLSNWTKIERELRELLRDSSAVAVTTMFDYYALPRDVPGRLNPGGTTGAEKGRRVQARIDESIGNTKFRSYLSVHEFEALLYSDPDLCGQHLGSMSAAAAMTRAISSGDGPEDVNDSPDTAPSKRILTAFPAYQKIVHGVAIVERIGLPAVRSKCPHFDAWVQWLESLAT
jgi:Domain of unknown function (DUF4276)